MAHDIKWLLFPRILRVDLYGDLRLEDLEQFSHDTIKHLEQGDGDAIVHMIVDDTRVGKPPIQLKKIQQALQYTQHPALGWQVAVGISNPLVNYVAPMVMKLIGVQLVRRHTQEEALEFLYAKDSSLKKIQNDVTEQCNDENSTKGT